MVKIFGAVVGGLGAMVMGGLLVGGLAWILAHATGSLAIPVVAFIAACVYACRR